MNDTEPFQFVAGRLALDFANTLDNRFDSSQTAEQLKSYEDVLRFCEQAGVLTASQARKVLRNFNTEEIKEALRSSIELREAIHGIFSATAGKRRPKNTDLAILNRHLTEAFQHRHIAARDGSFAWIWDDLEEQPAGALWPISYSAAELLVSNELQFVRECRNETCRWLFLDSSKNHSRAWCDMKLCGNRTKARRYHERHR